MERLWYSAEAEALNLRWEFAERMGLGEDWFQPSPPVQPSAFERAMGRAWSDLVNSSVDTDSVNPSVDTIGKDASSTVGGKSPLRENGT